MKSKLEKSREEQLAGDMLALVERFHAPSSHEDRTSRRAGLALPVALEALAVLAFARQLRVRKRRHDRRHGLSERVHHGIRRAFVLRHL